MRETVAILLEPDASPGVLPPSGTELETLTATLRGHIEVLIPEVQKAAGKLKKTTVTRQEALSCAWEARSRLHADPNSGYGGTLGHARRLARSLNALCNYVERLGGERS
ncbi:DUF6415 family natural product biosynthesis protein [Streptomyces sp. NPDC018693]